MSIRDKCIALRKEIFRNKLNEDRTKRMLFIKEKLMERDMKDDEFRQWEGECEEAVKEQKELERAHLLDRFQRYRRQNVQETGVF